MGSANIRIELFNGYPYYYPSGTSISYSYLGENICIRIRIWTIQKISYLKRYMYSFLFGMDENYSLRFDLS